MLSGSIHPQGWVPIETHATSSPLPLHVSHSSIHPQGWVPIETATIELVERMILEVAFTPKGGCPLKHVFKNSRADP